MAPFRAARSTRSGGRPGVQTDFDIVDGLPVRQWRLQEVPAGFETSADDARDDNGGADGKDDAWPELPLPRGSNLYAPYCLQLLRAARAGRIQKRKREHDGDDDRDRDRHDEHAHVDISKQGFLARKWMPVARQHEEDEPEYLAKRREGLPKHAPGFLNAMPSGEADPLILVEPAEEPVRPNRRVPPPRRKPKKGPGRKKKLAFTDGEGVSAAADEPADAGDMKADALGSGEAEGDGENGGDDDDKKGEGRDGDDEVEEGEIDEDEHAQDKEDDRATPANLAQTTSAPEEPDSKPSGLAPLVQGEPATSVPAEDPLPALKDEDMGDAALDIAAPEQGEAPLTVHTDTPLIASGQEPLPAALLDDVKDVNESKIDLPTPIKAPDTPALAGPVAESVEEPNVGNPEEGEKATTAAGEES